MKLADLVIQLSLGTTSLDKGLNEARRKVTHFAEGVKSTLEGIGIGFGLMEIAERINEIGRYEEQIRLAGQATGISTEKMSQLAFAFQMFKIPLHDAVMGLSYFDRVTGGLMRSKQGRVAVQLLGLSVRDLNGHLKNSGAMLLEVADKFSKMKDSTAKTAAATALFGQTYGLELIPFLDQGAKGIQRLEAIAKSAGLSLTDEEAREGQQYQQSLTMLKGAFKGVEIELTGKLFPSLTYLMALMSGDSNATRAFSDRMKELGLEAAKLLTYLNPLSLVAGNGLRAGIQKRIDALATQEQLSRDAMTKQLNALAKLGSGATLNIPANILQSAPKAIHRVADALKDLQRQLVGLSQGEVAKGMQRLKDLGATPAQLAQGKSILTQIQAIQAVQRAQKAYSAALNEYGSQVRSLAMDTSSLGDAQKQYMTTLDGLNKLAQKGVDITNGLTLARERYRQTLLRGIQTPEQMGIKVPAGQIPGASVLGNIADNSGRLDKMHKQAAQIGKDMQSSFVGMIVEGQSFSSVLKNLTTLFAEFLLKAVVFKELSNAFGATGVGGLIGSFFSGLAGGKASGGPVTAGSLYMVGESGPELFAPGVSGTIIPNGGASSVRGGATVNIDARGADAGVEHRIMRAMQAMRKQMIGASLVANYEYQARGGSL